MDNACYADNDTGTEDTNNSQALLARELQTPHDWDGQEQKDEVEEDCNDTERHHQYVTIDAVVLVCCEWLPESLERTSYNMSVPVQMLLGHRLY